jgi:hypothetical protein
VGIDGGTDRVRTHEVDRKPPEVHARKGSERGRLAPQANSGNRDIQLAADHLSERFLAGQDENTAHFDRCREAGETHG